jgi:hypothetical protein
VLLAQVLLALRDVSFGLREMPAKDRLVHDGVSYRSAHGLAVIHMVRRFLQAAVGENAQNEHHDATHGFDSAESC